MRVRDARRLAAEPEANAGRTTGTSRYVAAEGVGEEGRKEVSGKHLPNRPATAAIAGIGGIGA